MKVNNKKVRKFRTGGPQDRGDEANKTGAYGDGSGGVDRSAVGPGSQYAKNVAQANQVQAKTGPVQVPTIGPLSYGFNAISKGLYNAKNLKDARKDDILGGEMLTTGQKTTGPAQNYGDGDHNRKSLCPDGTKPPCKTPATQIKNPVSTPNTFLSGFKAYDDGGEVIISSNVDKSLL